jgi:glutathione synthase
MHFVVIMDRVETVLVNADTSFAFMEEAQSRGHRVDHCLNTDLFLDQGRLYAKVAQATMQRDPKTPITLGTSEVVNLHDVDVILVRTDPPVDDNYLWCTLLLERVKHDTLVLNDPQGLRNANEKLFACAFPELMPETMVGSNKEQIKAFVHRVGGHAVIKPLDGKGGEGVLVLREGDPNFNAIIEATTRDQKRPAMVQVFMPQVKVGDKRVLLLDGEVLGALLRVPAKEEVRSNLRVGGTAVKTSVDAAEQHIIDTLAPALKREGLWFVGIDIIGGKLTEVNVTSPTGIQAMSRLDGINYSAKVIEWIESRVRSTAA